MKLFKEMEGEAAILATNGTYAQVGLYTNNGFIFAKSGSGFVRLMLDGSTSKTNATTRCVFITLPAGAMSSDPLGRLAHRGTEGTKPIAPAKLLIANT